MDEQTSQRRFFVWAALFVERYVLAAVFLWLAWGEWTQIDALLRANIANKTALYGGLIKHGVLLVAGVFTGLFLLIGRKPAAAPAKIQFVLIPLLATFFNTFYFLGAKLPPAWQKNFVPERFQIPIMVTGMIFVLVGPMISLWGLFTLRRSFGIFVAIRDVILKGPYRWVRHPMYLGWIISFVGIALAFSSAAYFLIVAIHIGIVLYRARLEERNLAEHSEAYREHMKRTGFLFPKFRG